MLPFLHALGRASGDANLADRALSLYRRYPATAPNRVTVEMAHQLGGPDGAKAARTACRQHGLIHLYRHWCDSRDGTRCAMCSIRLMIARPDDLRSPRRPLDAAALAVGSQLR